MVLTKTKVSLLTAKVVKSNGARAGAPRRGWGTSCFSVVSGICEEGGGRGSACSEDCGPDAEGALQAPRGGCSDAFSVPRPVEREVNIPEVVLGRALRHSRFGDGELAVSCGAVAPSIGLRARFLDIARTANYGDAMSKTGKRCL